MQSEQIDQLAAALAIAQGKITGALKDSANPFFKSRYADLASVWDACRDHLSSNGLAVIQTTETVADSSVTVVTTLAHKSGQWIRGVLTMTPKDASPQAVGSCLTYARRYALAAIVGVAQVDDDANAASKKQNDTRDGLDIAGQNPETVAAYVKRLTAGLISADNKLIYAVQDELHGNADLFTAVWDKLSSKMRSDVRSILSARPKAA